ncbi:hypothetical protein DUI87_04403 [Hirundo rustica rustica]|uniref:Uncharacterized protein n=1 Tax=Hirundo rustica rustica TaxID=333673 RepID=A0A3M0KYZ1_HIRRU|nr:hypothetical protein DUI87_04403 [Hirundo rustica rustica]
MNSFHSTYDRIFLSRILSEFRAKSCNHNLSLLRYLKAHFSKAQGDTGKKLQTMEHKDQDYEINQSTEGNVTRAATKAFTMACLENPNIPKSFSLILVENCYLKNLKPFRLLSTPNTTGYLRLLFITMYLYYNEEYHYLPDNRAIQSELRCSTLEARTEFDVLCNNISDNKISF